MMTFDRFERLGDWVVWHTPTCGHRPVGAITLQIPQIRGKWRPVYGRVIGADLRRACFAATDA